MIIEKKIADGYIVTRYLGVDHDNTNKETYSFLTLWRASKQRSLDEVIAEGNNGLDQGRTGQIYPRLADPDFEWTEEQWFFESKTEAKRFLSAMKRADFLSKHITNLNGTKERFDAQLVA